MNSYGTHQIQISEIFWTQPNRQTELILFATLQRWFFVIKVPIQHSPQRGLQRG